MLVRLVKLSTASIVCFTLIACTSGSNGYYDRDGPPLQAFQFRAYTADKQQLRVEEPHKWANRPYTVMGKRYVPVTGDQPMTQVGQGSWYGKQFHGKKTSIGETYDMYQLTAAHPTMELPSFAKVTNLENGRSIIVRVNDRGPFLHNRIIDLSYAGAVRLGYQKQGTAKLKVERITRTDIAKGNIPSTSSGLTTVVANTIEKLAKQPQKSNRSATTNQVTSSNTGMVLSLPVEITEAPMGSEKTNSTLSNQPTTDAVNQLPATSDIPTTTTIDRATTGWSVQLGSFQQLENALSAVAHSQNILNQTDLILTVRVVRHNNYFKVITASSTTREQAAELVPKLSEHLGQPVFIVPFQ